MEGPFLPPHAPGGEPPPRFTPPEPAAPEAPPPAAPPPVAPAAPQQFGEFAPPVDQPPALAPRVTGMPVDEGNGVGIAAFSFGIAGLVMFVFSGFGLLFILNLPLSITAWVLGPRGVEKVDEGKTREHRSLARAGHVMGIVGTILGIVAIVIWVLVLVLSADARDALSA